MAEKHKLNVGLGTDVGGGTSFSLLQTLNEAYKVDAVARCAPESVQVAVPGDAGRCAGAASGRQDRQPATGCQTPTSWCWITTPRRCSSYRLKQANNIAETLFVLMTLGDDRTVQQTYAAGALVHQR